MRIVDLFCGIGGVAEAVRDRHGAEVIAAIDIDRDALAVHDATHGTRAQCSTLESIRSLPEADLWWLSPPCQPYTRRGRGLQECDPRSQALAHLIDLIARDLPPLVMLENVPEFGGSTHHQRITSVLWDAGYSVRDDLLCPTQWGVPMRRKRFYLRARRSGRPIPRIELAAQSAQPLAGFLDESNWRDPALRLPPEQAEKYRRAIHVVDPRDAGATAACFTSAYGRSPVRCGSYLRCRQAEIIRRFAPDEIARLMGFGHSLRWPESCGPQTRYRLIGNSLSVTVVKALLRSMM